MQSARSRRETYVGPWLPEPVDTSADPELGAERGEGLEAGVLLLLEKLSPTERAAYILREAFEYAYRDIADILRLQEANARQLVTRARQHVANGRRTPAKCDRAETSSRSFHCRGPKWRRRRPRRSLCVGRRLDLGRRRIGARCLTPSPRSERIARFTTKYLFENMADPNKYADVFYYGVATPFSTRSACTTTSSRRQLSAVR